MGLHRDGSKWNLDRDTVEARRYGNTTDDWLKLQTCVLGSFQRRCLSGELLL